MFFRLLISIVNDSNYTKCISLNNQQCMTLPTPVNVHPNKYLLLLMYILTNTFKDYDSLHSR